MEKAKQNLKTTQDKKQSYLYFKRVDRDFQVGDNVYLKIKLKISTLNIRKFAKLYPRFCIAFETLSRIWPIVYQLVLLDNIKVQNFYISWSKKYVHNSNQIIDWVSI